MNKLTRNCPDCNKVIVYSRIDAFNNAQRRGRKCKSCCKKGAANPAHNRDMFGVKNPFYGKKHKQETIDILKKKNSGKSVSTETKQKLSVKSKEWHNNKSEEKTAEWKRNISLSRIGNKHWMYGKRHSDEYKRKQSEIAKERLKHSPPKFIPNYSKKACDLFDEINNYFGWNGQHAECGGEKVVDGFWVDYYEPNLNLIIEYDEPHHFIFGKLREIDISRQLIIINKIGCKFVRLKEGTGLQEAINILESYGYEKSMADN